MTVLEIVNFPAQVLRLKAKPVQTFDKNLQKLIDDMFETLHSTHGVGLAASQVRQPICLLVVEYADNSKENNRANTYVLINPKIVSYSKETKVGMEGCLSIPNLAGNVERSDGVTIEATNRYGYPMRISATGWLARIFQHEIDHLNGVLYIDKAINLYSLSGKLL